MRFLLLIVLLVNIITLRAQSDESWRNQYIVKFVEAQSPIDLVALETTDTKSIQEQISWHLLSKSRNIWLVRWEDEVSKLEVARFLNSLEAVSYFHEDAPVESRNITPNDLEYNLQWWLPLVKANQAWTQNTGGLTARGDTIVIAVLEKFGPDFTHEDLQGVFWINQAEIPGDGIDNDGNGFIDDYRGLNIQSGRDNHNVDIERHASPVVGIIGARSNNLIGVAGVNWNMKVLMVSGLQLISQIVTGYEYVYDMRRRYEQSGGTDGAYIMATNASFGRDDAFPSDFPAWCEMYDALGEFGILTAASTVNANVNVDIQGDLPALCPSEYLISVTSTTRADIKATGAGFGRVNIDLGAPGLSVLTTYPGNLYSLFDGTSAAAPIVTGAIGLLYSMPSVDLADEYKANPAATALKIKKAILDGVDPIPSLNNVTVTGGRLNIGKSMIELAKAYDQNPVDIEIITIHPNPAKEEIIYSFNSARPGTLHDVLVVNGLGQVLIYEQQYPSVFGQNRFEMNISKLPAGTYWITIKNEKLVASGKFVKSQ
jgi:hypothetical protein